MTIRTPSHDLGVISVLVTTKGLGGVSRLSSRLVDYIPFHKTFHSMFGTLSIILLDNGKGLMSDLWSETRFMRVCIRVKLGVFKCSIKNNKDKMSISLT